MAETKRTDLSTKLHVASMSATILAMGTGFAPEAQAMKMITGGPGLNFDIGPDTPYFLDLDGNGNTDFVLVNIPDLGNFAFNYNFFNPPANAIEGINIPPVVPEGLFGNSDVSPFFNKAYANNRGDTVGPTNAFVPYLAKLQSNNLTTYPNTYWPVGEQRFLGLRFEIPDDPQAPDGTFTTHYGFAALTVAPDNLGMNLDCYGYESDADTAVKKSCTVPEPASLLLLAAGAVPLLAIRRRRVRH